MDTDAVVPGPTPASRATPQTDEEAQSEGSGNRWVSIPWMLGYGAARFGIGVHDIFFNSMAGLFLAGYGLPNWAIGFLSNERSFIGSPLLPVFGAFSDRIRSPLGRRKPFMAIGGLAAVIGFLLLAQRPPVWAAVTVLLLVPIMIGLAATAYQSLLGDVVVPEQRGAANGVNVVMGMAGGVGLLLLGSRIWEDQQPLVFVIIAACLALGFAITILTIAEPVPGPVPPSGLSWRPSSYLRGILAHHEAVKYVVCYFFFWFGIGGVTPFLTRFGHEELGVPENETFILLIAVVFATLAFAAPAGWLGDRFGKKRVMLIGLIAFGALIIVGSQVRTVNQVIPVLILAGVAQAVPSVLAYPLFTELIPARRMGELTGLSTMIWSLAQPLGATLLGALADATGSLRTVLVGGGIALLVTAALLRSVRVPRAEESGPDFSGASGNG
jgi:MFS-type transporter involved in bile tolerance (Atg22 family)